MKLTVDPKHVLFDIVLPFIRARHDRRNQAHSDAIARIKNGECPECMRKYNRTLWHKHFDERHDPVWRRALELEPIRPRFRLTRFGRHMLHVSHMLNMQSYPHNFHPDNLD